MFPEGNGTIVLSKPAIVLSRPWTEFVWQWTKTETNSTVDPGMCFTCAVKDIHTGSRR